MKHSTHISIRFYSYYLMVMGTILFCIPNTVLPFFGFTPTSEPWIRVLGAFTVTVSMYYWYASMYEQTAFYKATIMGRLFFFVTMIVLVFFFQQSPLFVMFGSIDLFGAMWTGATYFIQKHTVVPTGKPSIV